MTRFSKSRMPKLLLLAAAWSCSSLLLLLLVPPVARAELPRPSPPSSSRAARRRFAEVVPRAFAVRGGGGGGNFLDAIAGEKYETAKAHAALEQEVEDYNAVWVASAKDRAESTSRRRLICLPLDDRFDPPMGQFSHEHVQTGDKMSLPKVFWEAIQVNKAEVPWVVSVSRVDGVTKDRIRSVREEHAAEPLNEVVGCPLDCRAPPNYVFLPLWMMRALGLHPRDVVDVKLVTSIPPGSMVKFRPHDASFATDIANPQSVLETELRHYASLTKGSTIAFDYNGKRYLFDVVELRAAPRGEKQPMVKCQDCDVATVFLPAKGAPKRKKRAGPPRATEEEEEDDDDETDDETEDESDEEDESDDE